MVQAAREQPGDDRIVNTTDENETNARAASEKSSSTSPPRIVVVGASAGGVEALSQLTSQLPPDFPAPVLIVLHVPALSASRLPDILSRRGPLPANKAVHGEPLRPGRIYTAPPDKHMIVADGTIELTRGPRENRSRPAVDPLFRSAARSFGSGAIGVILSGSLYDGAAGMLAISARGGTTIVQHPDDATFDPMPTSALRLVDADYVLPADEIGPLLHRLANEPVSQESMTMVDDEPQTNQIIARDIAELASDERANDLTIYTCPDCGGAMWQVEEGLSAQYACHVGHTYNPEYLFAHKTDELEGALWACVRLFTENATLAQQVANRSKAL